MTAAAPSLDLPATAADFDRRAAFEAAPLKALTLYPEHAECFRLGLRTIETRSRHLAYRGLLAIHAGRRDPDSVAAQRDPITRAAFAAIPHGDPITRGAIVAVGPVVACAPIIGQGDEVYVPCIVRNGLTLQWFPEDGPARDLRRELPLGDFTPGRYGLLIDPVIPLAEPVPCRGAQGLWTVPADVVAAVREAAAL
jgi:hypothetical protein